MVMLILAKDSKYDINEYKNTFSRQSSNLLIKVKDINLNQKN